MVPGLGRAAYPAPAPGRVASSGPMAEGVANEEGPVSPKPDLRMPRAEVDELLRRPLPGVLSTLGRDGFPHSVGMWFVYDEDAGRILMFAYAKSQKVCNLERDPRAGFLVEHGEPYSDLKGVLVRGRAELIREHERVFAIGRALYERYLEPRTGVAFDEGPRITIERQALKRVGIALPLERIVSWDHARG